MHSKSRARWLWVMPNLVMLCFLLALAGYLWLLHKNEQDRSRDVLIQDVLWQEQALRLALLGQQNQLAELAAALPAAAGQPVDFGWQRRSEFFLKNNPEVLGLLRLDSSGAVQTVWPVLAVADLEPLAKSDSALEALRRARLTGRGQYGPPQAAGPHGYLFTLVIPQARSPQAGFLLALYSFKGLLDQQVPWWIAEKYRIALIDLNEREYASRHAHRLSVGGLSHDLQFDPPGYGLLLRAVSYRTGSSVWQPTLQGMLVALAILLVWLFWVLRRQMLQRGRVEQALRRESAMRQAMEDSLVTGMLALDREGRIIYVNRAFCAMVGYGEAELLGLRAPMPYWATDAQAECAASYQSILRGELPAQGYTLRFMRKSGEGLDVRLYASRLIDDQGEHTGWMASLYDITELKREREALKASHQRFVTVLNGLTAAVSVEDVDSGELLFCNQPYQRRFGLTPGAVCPLPLLPADLASAACCDAECPDPHGNGWFHIERRRSEWVDGRDVWLQLATDISAYKQAQENERLHMEKLQQTTRLISMGEMASSLAHELNQPLTAIASYCAGASNLLQQADAGNGQNGEAPAVSRVLEKIQQQAYRAGEIIRGIREFVQRSEPKLSPCQLDELLDSVLTLLAADLRRQSVRLHRVQSTALPALWLDRVMIEQLLFNLLKNGIEAMQGTPPTQRVLLIDLAVSSPRWLTVRIADRGCGVPPDLASQLFKPFFSTKSSGMGIGLNICRAIVEYHRGRLWLEHNPGGGTLFCFSLPITDPASDPAASETP